MLRYESWKNYFLLLKKELSLIVDAFNSTKEYRNAGFRMKFYDYDMLSFEKYMDLCNGKKATKTWFIAFALETPTRQERILFFFVSSTRKIAEIKISPVSLIIARAEDGGYKILVSEPINLREICLSEDQLVFFDAENNFEQGNIKTQLQILIADVIKSYL